MTLWDSSESDPIDFDFNGLHERLEQSGSLSQFFG